MTNKNEPIEPKTSNYEPIYTKSITCLVVLMSRVGSIVSNQPLKANSI